MQLLLVWSRGLNITDSISGLQVCTTLVSFPSTDLPFSLLRFSSHYAPFHRARLYSDWRHLEARLALPRCRGCIIPAGPDGGVSMELTGAICAGCVTALLFLRN